MIDLTFAVLGAIAAAMAASTAVFVRWAGEAQTGLRSAIVVFLLLMMTGMLAGGLVYALAPSAASAVAGLWLASAVMSAAVVVVFVAFLREVRRAAAVGAAAPARPLPASFVAVVILLVVVNEFLMGWALGALSGMLVRFPAADGASVLAWGSSVVVSPWFVFTMAAEMVITASLLRRELSGPVLIVLLVQGALMFLSPPAFPTGPSGAAALDVGSVAMIGLFVYLMEYLYRHRSFSGGLAGYLGRLLPVYALMMAGLFLWAEYGASWLFAAAVLAEMAVFFEAVLRPAPLDGPTSFSWQERPAWTTGALAAIFLSELFMGAILAGQLTPSVYAPGPRLPLAGSASVLVGNAAANAFYFVADTTASTWFLLMMGVEMGALVVLRLREVHGRETRARLVLMLACYAAFAVFYPSVYYAALAPGAPGAVRSTDVPFLGWNMGLGSAPLGVDVLLVVGVTYGVFVVVTVLFGRRAVCSVFCSAATMYQGTTLDAMKSFNRSSPTARRYLGSRLSGAYRATTAAVLVALAGTAVTSFLDATGRAALFVGGVDPSVFLFDLSFGVLWYGLFVAVPYAGEYNCVTMGWCYTGLLAGASSRVGFFRLRVKDKEVCRRCTTFDCAKSCPVGLTDLPAQFRSRGEYRGSKCCGVGDCAEACPYGNLYLADVRHALRARFKPLPVPRPADLLPMAGTPGPAPAAPAASPGS